MRAIFSLNILTANWLPLVWQLMCKMWHTMHEAMSVRGDKTSKLLRSGAKIDKFSLRETKGIMNLFPVTVMKLGVSSNSKKLIQYLYKIFQTGSDHNAFIGSRFSGFDHLSTISRKREDNDKLFLFFQKFQNSRKLGQLFTKSQNFGMFK